MSGLGKFLMDAHLGKPWLPKSPVLNFWGVPRGDRSGRGGYRVPHRFARALFLLRYRRLSKRQRQLRQMRRARASKGSN